MGLVDQDPVLSFLWVVNESSDPWGHFTGQAGFRCLFLWLGFRYPRSLGSMCIVLDMPSVTAFAQAKEEFGSDSELGVLCKLLAAHSIQVG